MGSEHTFRKGNKNQPGERELSTVSLGKMGESDLFANSEGLVVLNVPAIHLPGQDSHSVAWLKGGKEEGEAPVREYGAQGFARQ